MALDIDTYHRPTRPSTQKPLEACYGYPPPPSALLQMPIPTSARSDSQDAGSPSPTPPAISPPTTPLLLTQQSFNQNGMHQELLNIECGTDLAEYLAKNPGMKRLYNNHGSIKRPACVSCNESRKKCDLQRPCTRCVKQKLPCIERPPRAKRRKIDETSHKHKCSTNIVSYGLPSPVSEPRSETRVGTPMELDYGPIPLVSTGNKRDLQTSIERFEAGMTAEQYNHKLDDNALTRLLSDCIDLPLGLLELPLPMGPYLDGISSTLSSAPIFGLESSDPLVQSQVLIELEGDLRLEDESLDIDVSHGLLACTDGSTSRNGTPDFDFQDVDMDTLMAHLPTDQQIKDILGGKSLELDMGDTHVDRFEGIFTLGDELGANLSSATGTYDWGNDWSIG